MSETMSLRSLTYTEYEGDPKHWELDQTEFGNVNLMVGQNSTGKSRVLNVISSVCRIISGAQATPFTSGKFSIDVELGGKLFSYLIWFQQGIVNEETLRVNGEERLVRNAQGEGRVYFASEKRDIPFQISPETIAIQNKNDKLQHPFIHELAEWASGVALYRFGSDFGKTRLIQRPPIERIGSVELQSQTDVDNTVGTYVNAFQRFGDELDRAIIRDMAVLGYQLDEVAVESLGNVGPGIPDDLLGLVTVERDLGALRNSQLMMSQGMFRALALIIHLNLAVLSNEKNLLLIDDIGEGLDYERATKIIDLIIGAAEKKEIQIVMTSNDRFVMNRVPLDYWAVLRRVGRHVKAFTPQNSPEEFENFKFIGLSNFDFFKDTTFH
jgi:hypothetical protein